MAKKTEDYSILAPYRDWAIQAHAETNHFYDEYLPYEFHLRMVANLTTEDIIALKRLCEYFGIRQLDVQVALWCHDTVEDARKNYNDIMKLMNPDPAIWRTPEKLNRTTAEIVRAVTNYGRGRNRDERMPDFVYEDIRTTPGATFTKLRDRIANVQYGKMSRSGMFDKYKNENPHFIEMLWGPELEICKPMVDYLDKIFNNEA